MIKDSGKRTEFETGAKRDIQHGKGRMDLLPWYGIIEVSKHCEEGAKKYGEHNVDRGIPLHSLMDSASRHLAKFIAGERDEDHLRAAAWNILWALNQRTTHPELNDMYWAKKESQASLYVRLTYKELRTMMGKMVYVASVLANVENGSYKVLVFGNDDDGKVELIPDKNLSAPYNKLTLIGDKSEKDIEVYKMYESKD